MAHGSAGHGHLPPAMSSAERHWYAETAQRLMSSTDRLVADIGCGEAPMAIELARVLPNEARIVALDSDPEVLDRARATIADAGLTGRITTVAHDLTGGVDSVRAVLADADLIWASSSLHHVGDQQRVISGLASLLTEGGRLAVAEGGLAERHLPWDVGVGEPGLEMRLDAAQDRWFARMRAELPGSVPMPYGWSVAMRMAGLSDITTTSVLFEEPTPLPPPGRATALDHLSQRAGRLSFEGFLDEGDAAAWDLLLDPENLVWLGHRDDLFSLTARTLYVGVRRF